MAIKKISLKNFTVFDSLDLDLSSGLNIFIGENGVGKTHVMKLIYSACKAVRRDVSFPQKVVRVFNPLDSNIQRLVSRKGGGGTASVRVTSDSNVLSMTFSTQTKKWDAEVKGEATWEKQLSDLTCTFIPAKEILSNAWNLEAAVASGNVDFDDTYVDVVVAAKIDINSGRERKDQKKYLDILQKISNGRVQLEKDRFFLKPGTQARIEFSLVAEGIRKIALLWQLIKNGTLEKGSILLWDEPEANLNPIHIPVIAGMLLMLQQSGVQVFVATHDYFLAKFLEIKRNEHDAVLFHSMYITEEGIETESKEHFLELEHNQISETFIKVYKDEIDKAME